jgi:protein-tyrosine-phosphatase
MKKNILVTVIIFTVIMSFAHAQKKVTKIEFSTLTRGSHQLTYITKDSVEIVKQNGVDTSEDRLFRKLKSHDWEDLVKALKTTSLEEIPTLVSPTKNRAFDGARHSSITIIVENGETYTHVFDNENPNEKLQPLMQCILRIAGN